MVLQKRSTNLANYFLTAINPAVRYLILSDTIIVGISGLIGPVFALFVQDRISGGDASVAGLAVGIYLFSKSVLQIPIANWLDKIKGEKDDFWVLFIFTTISTLLPITYLFINAPWQMFLVQFLLGVSAAFTFPAFMSIFTHHIDKDKEALEWGIYFSLTDIANALLAALGGYIAAKNGFNSLILLSIGLSVFGALFLFPIKKYIQNKEYTQSS